MHTKQQQSLFKSAKANLTPLMQQYLGIKNQYQDALLFFRLGDFYELFENDAIIASKILDIVLTARGKGTESEVPMCGIPFHAFNQYAKKLIDAGYKLAICEQLESPSEAKKRGYKSIVRRDVTRVITAGTIIEDELLDSSASHYICSIFINSNYAQLCISDITTSKVYLYTVKTSFLKSELTKLKPKEIIISELHIHNQILKDELQEFRHLITIRPNVFFSLIRCQKTILKFYNLHSLETLQLANPQEEIALGALLEYIEHSFKTNLPTLSYPKRFDIKHYMAIDAATRKNLEIMESADGDKAKSLFSLLDCTMTRGGKRKLEFYLNNPLIDSFVINNRLEIVERFFNNINFTQEIRNSLQYIPDFEHLISKICIKKASFDDFACLKQGLLISIQIAELINANAHLFPSNYLDEVSLIGNYAEFLSLLESAIDINSPTQIKFGFNKELDQLVDLSENANRVVEDLAHRYRLLTGVNTLKIKYNEILGHFIEVSKAGTEKLDPSIFHLKQHLVGNSRFITEELNNLSSQIASASSNIQAILKQVLNELSLATATFKESILITADAISTLDVYSSFSHLAHDNNWTKPVIDDSCDIEIIEGRNPIIEHALKEKFIPNNLYLSNEKRIILLTAPNMTGKSTFLRQNALIIILAQMGSFVPAKLAKIGIVDQVFSRIGASDNLFAGNSTFMIEMIETATILNNATSRSFIVFDELGRGTATADGIAIAQSVIEEVHNNIKARTLFATHYHELTELESILLALKNYTIKVTEHAGKVVFMHEIIQGKAASSYGINVAELAGLPQSVITRAHELLRNAA
jgi:DNA mismatch repair protein MutS